MNPRPTGEQIKAARKLLGWTRGKLAHCARIATPYTVAKAEEGMKGSPPTDEQIGAMVGVLEAAGIEFTKYDGQEVRLRRPVLSLSLTGEQIRVARALIGWEVPRLAQRSFISTPTLQRAECENGDGSLTRLQQARLRSVLEAAGVEFTNGDQPGVRLKR